MLEGLREGETIVTSSQFLIDSESNLKAAVSAMRGSDDDGSTTTMTEPETGPVEAGMSHEGMSDDEMSDMAPSTEAENEHAGHQHEPVDHSQH